MLAQTAYPGIESYAREDFNSLCEQVDKKWNLDPQLLDIDIQEEISIEGVESIYTITGTFLIEGEKFTLSYKCVDNINNDELEFDELTMYDLHDAYMKRYYESMNMHHDAKYFADRLESRGVKASTAIMAADDDPFADMGFGDEDTEPVDDSDSVEDSIDDMADTLDELSDKLDDIEEDDIDIETENNIADHFIAECEKCHGVFITAVVESDQEISKISGICPLCDQECDQYLKWVIKEY